MASDGILCGSAGPIADESCEPDSGARDGRRCALRRRTRNPSLPADLGL